MTAISVYYEHPRTGGSPWWATLHFYRWPSVDGSDPGRMFEDRLWTGTGVGSLEPWRRVPTMPHG